MTMVTVHTKGMPAHLRFPKINLIPILNEPRRAEAPSTTKDAKDTWCQLLKSKPQRSMGLNLPAVSS
jgi:hypothetical protein